MGSQCLLDVNHSVDSRWTQKSRNEETIDDCFFWHNQVLITRLHQRADATQRIRQDLGFRVSVDIRSRWRRSNRFEMNNSSLGLVKSWSPISRITLESEEIIDSISIWIGTSQFSHEDAIQAIRKAQLQIIGHMRSYPNKLKSHETKSFNTLLSERCGRMRSCFPVIWHCSIDRSRRCKMNRLRSHESLRKGSSMPLLKPLLYHIQSAKLNEIQ
jgi:hypothetical protein